MSSSTSTSNYESQSIHIPGEICINGFYYPNIQVNGQRHVGPIKNWLQWNLQPPSYEREIWIGNIPAIWDEIVLMKHLVKIGLVYYLRFMVNFSGQSRGFAYIQFIHTRTDAVDCLNKFFKLNDLRIYANWSFNIRKLEIGNLYPYLEEDHKYLLAMLTNETQCQNAEIGYRQNKLIVILTYHNNRHACLSRRHLLSNIERFGSKTYVCWFDRKIMKINKNQNLNLKT